MKGQTNKRDPWYPERSWPAKFAWTGFYLLLLALLMLLCLAIDREFAPRIHPAWLSRLFSIAIFGCGFVVPPLAQVQA